METKCVVFVFLTVCYQCYGGLLDGLLSGAQETHNNVHDVAHTFLGGLSHGLNLNFQGHIGTNEQQRPRPQQNNEGGQVGKPGETVVIVVEQEPNRDQYRPGYNNRPHHHNGYGNNNNNNRPGYGNGNNPNYNNQGQGNPYQKPNYQNNHHNQGYGNGNWHGNHENYRPNNGNYQPNNENYKPNNGNYQPNNGNYQPNNGNPNQNNYGQPNQPPFENPHQGGQHNQYTTEYVTKEPEKNVPNYGSIYNPSTENNPQSQKPSDGYDQDKFNEKTTKKPNEDKPLFVPLNPNEYNYGGDKIDVTAPKRETNDQKPKPAETSDDDFPIDIRLVPLPQVRRLQAPSEPPQHLIQNLNRPSKCNYDKPQPTGSDLDLPRVTLRENQPRRRLFISRLIPAKMSQPSARNSSSTAQKSSVYDNDNFEQENKSNGSNPPVTTTTGVSSGNVITTTKPEQDNVLKPANGTEITLDERSSFDGDQCPTGYVRLNGKCVPSD